MRVILIAALLGALCSTGHSVRILAYFPVPAPSHHYFFQPILTELARRGHQIDYYSPFPMRNPHSNITHVELDNLMQLVVVYSNLFDHWKMSVQKQVRIIWDSAVMASEEMCRTKGVQDLLSSRAHYDVILHESLFVGEIGSIFQHKFNALPISLLSYSDLFNVNEMSGLVTNPAFMVNGFTVYTDRMSFWQRLHNAYFLAETTYQYYAYLRALQRVADECYRYPGWEGRPPLAELLSDQALILANRHHSVGFAYPNPPQVKDVGGAVLAPRKPLPEDIEKFMSEAKHGVIYFSLGSLFDMNVAMPHLRDIFTKAFAKRNERVLWKWNSGPWEGLPSNIKLSKWFPQQDILAHKNMKLFITHGGLQSAFETVNFGIPVISIPGFADQTKNALALAQHGYGVVLTLGNITESSLDWALDEILKNPEYKRQVMKGSELLKDSPMAPVDEAVYWVEYVIGHGRVLQPAGAKLSFIQLHLIDVYAFVLLMLALSLYTVKLFLSFICKTLFSKTVQNPKIDKKKRL